MIPQMAPWSARVPEQEHSCSGTRGTMRPALSCLHLGADALGFTAQESGGCGLAGIEVRRVVIGKGLEVRAEGRLILWRHLPTNLGEDGAEILATHVGIRLVQRL